MHILAVRCWLALLTIRDVCMSVTCRVISATMPQGEEPVIHCHPTQRNHELISRMPSLMSFTPLWFARYYVSQTVLAELIHTSTYTKLRNMVKMFSTAIWFNNPTCFYKEDDNMANYYRQYVMSHDMQPMAIDWINHTEKSPRAIIVMSPGINADISSYYIQPWFQISKEKRYVVAVLHRRGLVRERPMTIKTTKFCSYADTKDMDTFYGVIKGLYPGVPTIGVGVSAGGNHMAKSLNSQYLAIDAFVNIACANDILRSYRVLCSSNMYDSVLSMGWRRVAKNHPHLPVYNGIGSMARLTEMDNAMCLRLGYKDLVEYYKSQSSWEDLLFSNIPTLCMASKDDIMLGSTAAMYEDVARRNTNVIAVTTKLGGHAGWLQNDMTSWMDRVVVEFIEAQII